MPGAPDKSTRRISLRCGRSCACAATETASAHADAAINSPERTHLMTCLLPVISLWFRMNSALCEGCYATPGGPFHWVLYMLNLMAAQGRLEVIDERKRSPCSD